ncbi:LCP family protein [Phocicoccus pinnipedialis]|uniref:Transcriptional regulator YwtF n=1 Tax=Phocicoccus pinnipedialis TaxID=110845 RepID=A0A6V7RM92_9BACL|nr:LCP family protein [Jeotgalicoccus pinnipedialis]MBP1938817.1 LCP family protein required for cell wall assembly [Jeotgalicoccus pinnipedialis]CAD2079275.1 Putative transcriptional regulator YwtF [Jeotgalicoccus pinnipedialis]
MEENIQIRKRRKKRKPKWLKVLLIIFIAFILISIGIVAYTFYKLNNFSSDIHEPIERAEKSALRDKEVDLNRKEPLSIALFGVDSNEERDSVGSGERSDSIILLSINPNDNKTVMISIPRDTRSEIVGNNTIEKINHAYAYGGARMAIDSLENLMNIPIDHYVTINMDGLEELIDVVGGVDVTSNATFTVKGNSYVEGQSYEMYGEEALAFTRSRYEDGSGGDFGRQERQQLVVQALGEKLISIGSIGRMNSILDAVGNNVKTDLTMSDLQDIGTKYGGARKNVERLQLEGEGATLEDGLWYFLPYDESIEEASSTYRKNLEID